MATDHLDGSAVVTNASGTPVEVTDYYPYGSIRLDEKSGSFNEQRKYIGELYDQDTGLNYLNARYQDPAAGRFISEDPIFLGVGTLGKSQVNLLLDPQQMNGYGYARDNPIVNSDPSGRWYKEFLSGHQSWSSFEGEIDEATEELSESSPAWNFVLDHPYIPAVVGTAPLATADVALASLAAYEVVGAAYSAYQTAGMVSILLPSLYALESNNVTNLASTAEDSTAIELNEPIDIDSEALQHVVDRHGFNSTALYSSKFNPGEDISSLIRLGTQQVKVLQSGGNLERVFDVGRDIGIDRITGGQTSYLTVITNDSGKLITAFPGIPVR